MSQINSILGAVRKVVGPREAHAGPLPLHEPMFGLREQEAVAACVASGWTSTAGRQVAEFETMLAQALRVPNVVACVNGSSALHIALMLAGVKPGDEVIVPAISFAATANAVKYCGAWPLFADVSPDDFGIDPDSLNDYLKEFGERRSDGLYNRTSGRRISCLLPMHCFGYICQVDRLSEIAATYGLALVEDAAEAIGSRTKDRFAGSFGVVGALSFNGNKTVTTGGGGAIVTNDADLAARARHITTNAKVAHPWRFYHDMLGYNYRMPSLNAALGIAQLERLDTIVARKTKLHEHYVKAFADFAGVRLLRARADTSPNHWLNTIVIGEPESSIDDLLTAAHADGLLMRPVWDLLPTLPYFSDCVSAPLPNAKWLVARTVNLPSSEILGVSLT
jgi:perosamine synthetase